MGLVRACARAALLGALTALYFVGWTFGRPFAARSVDASRRWRLAAYGGWARRALRILGARVEVFGAPPPAPCLIVSNHQSYVDILLLASTVGAVFVSKAEVERWPAVGFLARSMGTIFIRRERKRDIPEVNARIEGALEGGERVVLFPEGTSTDGEAVAPFRPSLLEPAAGSRYPVRCASLDYEAPAGGPPASQTVCWWGDMTFGSHLWKLLSMSHFHARVELAPEPLHEPDRKLLARTAHERVAGLHARLRGLRARARQPSA